MSRTLLPGNGVPMLCGGGMKWRARGAAITTLIARDNELSWFDWNLDGRRKRLRW